MTISILPLHLLCTCNSQVSAQRPLLSPIVKASPHYRPSHRHRTNVHTYIYRLSPTVARLEDWKTGRLEDWQSGSCRTVCSSTQNITVVSNTAASAQQPLPPVQFSHAHLARSQVERKERVDYYRTTTAAAPSGSVHGARTGHAGAGHGHGWIGRRLELAAKKKERASFSSRDFGTPRPTCEITNEGRSE
jgi:hypothetical protein